MRKILVSLMFLGVAACDAEGNLGREESPAWHQRISTAEKVAYFKPRCEAYGFSDPSTEMSNCIQKEIQDSIAAARARQNTMMETNAQLTAQRNQRLRTTCTTIGGITNCY